MTGKKIITPSDMRDAMEQFSIDEARMTAIGLPNFAPSFSVSCENHGGPGLAAIQQWDAKAQKWSLISDFIKTDSEVIGSLIAEDSAAYAKENKIAPQCS